MPKNLFPVDLPESQWVQFDAEGFSRPVCGVIYRTGKPPCCGVPLGGIGTGCLDIDARGVYGFSSIFNPASEARGWAETTMPFLALTGTLTLRPMNFFKEAQLRRMQASKRKDRCFVFCSFLIMLLVHLRRVKRA